MGRLFLPMSEEGSLEVDDRGNMLAGCWTFGRDDGAGGPIRSALTGSSRTFEDDGVDGPFSFASNGDSQVMADKGVALRDSSKRGFIPSWACREGDTGVARRDTPELELTGIDARARFLGEVSSTDGNGKPGQLDGLSEIECRLSGVIAGQGIVATSIDVAVADTGANGLAPVLPPLTPAFAIRGVIC